MITSTTLYWEKIPLWNSKNPKKSFDITRLWINFKNPEMLRKNI